MKKIFAANWKLQKTPAEAIDFAKNFTADLGVDFFSDKEIFIFPQNFSLDALATFFKNTEVQNDVQLGPQNIHFEALGAFTGENSAELAKKMGCQSVLLGHSERRQYFSETNAALAKKVQLSQQFGLLPVFCIGETIAERESGQTTSVCFNQLTQALSDADKSVRIIVAYEPVWAIGTGRVATGAQVQEVHAQIFNQLTTMGFKNFQILYGGSVKPDNAKALLAIPHVDGFLVGGASLDVKSFLQICQAKLS
jgi:triosephosphate isomerase